MVEGGDRRDILFVPIDGNIAVICHQPLQHTGVGGARVMRAVIGALLAPGQRRGDRKVEKLVIGCGDRADCGESGFEPAGQAEGGDAPSRFRRDVADRARLGKQAAQLDIGRRTLGVHIEWWRVRLDRTLWIVAMLF